MAVNTIIKNDISSTLVQRIRPLLGRPAEDSEVIELLGTLNNLPFPGFKEDEFSLFIENKPHGFCLLFQDAEVLNNDFATSKKSRLPILSACYFYPGGIEGFEKFTGPLPLDIAWEDNAASLIQSLGPHKSEIIDKKTGLVTSRRWTDDNYILIIKFKDGGNSIRHIFHGLI